MKIYNAEHEINLFELKMQEDFHPNYSVEESIKFDMIRLISNELAKDETILTEETNGFIKKYRMNFAILPKNDLDKFFSILRDIQRINADERINELLKQVNGLLRD